jgi:membrane protein implicated in regulation of membrane protease activity
VSEGELIEIGQPIEVIRVDGNRIVVRRPRSTDGKE